MREQTSQLVVALLFCTTTVFTVCTSLSSKLIHPLLDFKSTQITNENNIQNLQDRLETIKWEFLVDYENVNIRFENVVDEFVNILDITCAFKMCFYVCYA